MPKVPQARSRVAEARIAAPTSNVRVSREATGGGRALGGLSAAQKIFAEEKKKADDIAALDANSKLAAAETLLLSDPETGALNQKGKNAFSLGESVPENFDKSVKEIEDSLTTPEQQASFRRAVAARRENINRKVAGHVSRERVKFDNEVTDSFVNNEANAAAVNYNDPRRVEQSVKLQKAAIEDHGKRNGLPAEAVKLRTLEVASATHSNVVTKMIAEGDIKSAEKHFQKNKKDFTASHLATVTKDLETAKIRGESQAATDEIMGKTTTLQEGLDEARKIDDPKLRDETVRRVKQRNEEQRAAQRQQDESDYRQVSELAKEAEFPDQIPPNQWNKLSISQQDRLSNHMRNRRRGMTPPKNSQKYYDHMTLASAHPEKFMQKNLLEDQDSIDSGQMSQLIKMQTSMRKGGGKSGELKGFETKSQVLDGLMSEMDIDAKAKKGSDREATQKFRQALDDRVLEFEAQNKRQPNNAEIRKLGQDLQLEVVTDRGIFFDSKKRIFELEPGDTPEVSFEDIPAAEIAKAREAIKRRGVEPTDSQVLQLYSTKIRRIRSRGGQ